ncbi:serine hydrolase domain-containing protein [Kordiimonas gwangyangensis]|uniref:serine hydrolase domain-containing protein n=1 Tax=Kordiimonas gwangyangensis TaxID=288022 RepID=UPI00036D4246|nr:serine hydrolase domain-containing protein [Kordiimonas gwangyangensis]
MRLTTLFAAFILAATPAAHATNGTTEALVQAIGGGTFKGITSVLVAKDGKVLEEYYFGDGGPEVLNDTRSVTKTLTGMAVGAAIYQGALESENERVFPFFGDHAPIENMTDTKRAITVRDLMTMSSALDCDDSDADSPGNEAHMQGADNWTEFALSLPAREGYTRDADGLGPFHYCTAGVFLLGQVLERATGLSVDDFMAGAIFRPLSIERREWARSPAGEEQAGGGLKLTSRDLWKLAELARADGIWNGRRVWAKGWTAASTKPYREVNELKSYGYLWWLTDFKSGTTGKKYPAYFMAGNGGSKVIVVPMLKLVTVITATGFENPGMHDETTDMFERYILPAYERGAIHMGG